jgi:hypothetical protein
MAPGQTIIIIAYNHNLTFTKSIQEKKRPSLEIPGFSQNQFEAMSESSRSQIRTN